MDCLISSKFYLASPNLFKLVQTCSSLFKLVQTCSNLFHFFKLFKVLQFQISLNISEILTSRLEAERLFRLVSIAISSDYSFELNFIISQQPYFFVHNQWFIDGVETLMSLINAHARLFFLRTFSTLHGLF